MASSFAASIRWTCVKILGTLPAPGAHSGDNPNKEFHHAKIFSLDFGSSGAVAVFRCKRRSRTRRREKNKNPQRSRPRSLERRWQPPHHHGSRLARRQIHLQAHSQRPFFPGSSLAHRRLELRFLESDKRLKN